MRKLIVLSVFAFAAATSALAQSPQLQLDDLRAQQQAAQQRSIDQSNQIQALENRLRADQAITNLNAQSAGATVPQLRYSDPTVHSGTVTSPKYPSMPDSALADSNKRVQDAARNRR